MPVSLVMMGLGLFRFGMLGPNYQRSVRLASFRHPAMPRVGRRPAAQYLGPGEETLTLEGVIHPHFKGGLRQIEMMRLSAGTGAPMMLVDGLGWVWDRWVVTEIEEAKSVFLSDGAPRQIDFRIALLAYGGDRA